MAADPADNYIKMLDEIALTEGFHDFSGLRGTGSAKERVQGIIEKILGKGKSVTFNAIHNAYDKIGIYQDKSVTTHRTEWDDLTMVTSGGKATETEGLKTEDLIVDGAEGVCTIRNRDNLVYTWKVKHLTNRVGGADQYTDGTTALNYFTGFLTKNTTDEDLFVFLIDAVNVKFYQLFANDALNPIAAKGEKIYKAWYIDCREGTADSAGKPDLTYLVGATQGRRVQVEIVSDDQYNFDIKYPALEKGLLHDYHYLFDSIFSANVKFEVNKVDGIRSTTTVFHNKEFTTTVQVNKGRKEEHPNSVNALFPKLAQALKVFTAGNAKKADKDNYYVTLQQKRSGDAFATLSSMDSQRYPALPAGVDISVCTEDINNAAFGLAVGANITLTLYEQDGRGFTVHFVRQKDPATLKRFVVQNIARLTKEIEDQLLQNIRNYNDKDNIEELKGVINTYNTKRAEKINAITDDITTALKELDAKIDAADRAAELKKDGGFLGSFKKVLTAYLNLSTLGSLIPALPTNLGGVGLNEAIDLYIGVNTKAAVITEADFKQFSDIKEGLEKVRAMIYAVSDAKTGKADNTFNAALESAMGKVFTDVLNKKHASEINRRKVIEKLILFGTIFNKSNAATNALGIFQFFASCLEEGVLKNMHDKLGTALKALIDKLTTEADKAEVTKLKKVLQTLIRTTRDDINAPEEDEVPQTEILETVKAIDTHKLIATKRKQRGGDGESGPAAAAAAAEESEDEDLDYEEDGDDDNRQKFECTAFTPGLRILKAKGSKELNEEGYLKDATHMVEAFAQAAAAGGGAAAGAAEEAAGGGKPLPAPFQFNLHPLTYLFFYVRDTLFQLETLRENQIAYTRFAQFLLVWANSYEEIMKPYKPTRNPYAVRLYYGVLVQILLGHAPKALDKKRTPESIRAIYKSLKLPLAEIAEYACTINADYFGEPHLQPYQALPLNGKHTERILRKITAKFNGVNKVAFTSKATAEFLTKGLNKLYEQIPGYVGILMQQEKAYLQSILKRMGNVATKIKAIETAATKLKPRVSSSILRRYGINAHATTRKLTPMIKAGRGGGSRRRRRKTRRRR